MIYLSWKFPINTHDKDYMNYLPIIINGFHINLNVFVEHK